MLGVASANVAKLARAGLLKPAVQTLGGQRRFRRSDVRLFREFRASIELSPEQKQMEEDAIRMYQQGWPIRRVAEQFNCSYGTMRRILLKHTPLRNRGGAMTRTPTR